VMCGCVAEHRYRAFTHVVCITIPFRVEAEPGIEATGMVYCQDHVALPEAPRV
jgi:hypothetical protein